MTSHTVYVLESAIVPGDLATVWKLVKNMDFKFSKNVQQSRRAEGEDMGLGQFSIAYVDNTIQTVRITEIAERLPNQRSLGLEYVASDPPVAYSARMDRLVLHAVTHGASPQVYIEYSTDFPADASVEVTEDSKFKKREFFDDLVAFLVVK
uniref:Bet v I/Major latex protein domain-containing protein n=1 Tax=Noctiluca scintillans TaxID=2966 RepID=A0A7S1FBI8_NOCSC